MASLTAGPSVRSKESMSTPTASGPIMRQSSAPNCPAAPVTRIRFMVFQVSRSGPTLSSGEPLTKPLQSMSNLSLLGWFRQGGGRMNVMVTGGAGYIGSHAVKQLIDAGHAVVAVDNLFRGHAEAVDRRASFSRVALADTAALTDLLRRHKVDCVMHFAALAYVGESVGDPLAYYDNNTGGAVSLLLAMKAAGVRRMVFSSTCATYGEPETTPIVETMPQSPINPYGWSKWCVERVLRDYGAAERDFSFVALRYFNVAGCAADGSLGEDHTPETHLIPAAALGGPEAAGQAHRLRLGLPHARRHVHPRLRPRRGPVRRPHFGDGGPSARRRAVLQPRHRQGVFGAAK